MVEGLRTLALAGLGFALFACGTGGSAQAACQLIKATHSADSPAEAARSSQELALQSASELKSAKGWSSISVSAHKVKGDPFWKAVRPDGVPEDAMLKPDIITPRFYTTCFTGVVVPYVCTTGSSVCGQ
ncbi:MAG TPA: hypothetical protein VK955_01665 [Xanthobacteraceae bacterium]|nr:hypothetical protein [Xanthobacteraceae bacterium]